MGIAMTEIPFNIIGFDLDGTLFDTSLELAASLNHALESVGEPPIAAKETRKLVGMGTRHMLKMALERKGEADPAMVKRLMPVLIEHYEAHIGQNCPAFPGLLDALEIIQASGAAMAVVTNKYEHLATKLLKNVSLLDRFETVIGGDTMDRITGLKGRGKPEPDPIHEMIRRCAPAAGTGNAAFVGDSSFDIKAAHAAGIPAIAVSFGFLNMPAKELGADILIDHYDELIPALQKLG